MNFANLRTAVNNLSLHRINLNTMTQIKGPIEESIYCVLKERFEPVHIEVVNESYMHNVPKGAETHFKVLVVSNKFEELSLLKRHRLINEAVKEKLAGNFIHALSIEAKTPQQWNISDVLEPSPKCRGGFGK
uniref:BolA n=1 Tax=Glossina brevipalpis TaxID=37001 RepID=A0A1A9WC29_9MUSC